MTGMARWTGKLGAAAIVAALAAGGARAEGTAAMIAQGLPDSVAQTVSEAMAEAIERARAQAFDQAVAEAAAPDRELAEYYRESDYAPLWTGEGAADRARRTALLRALSEAGMHGLPVARYDLPELRARLSEIGSARDELKGQVQSFGQELAQKLLGRSLQ